MDMKVDALAYPHLNINKYKGVSEDEPEQHPRTPYPYPSQPKSMPAFIEPVSYDDDGDYGTVDNQLSMHGVVVHRQWVTLTAGMWPTPPSSAVAAADSSSAAPSWRIPAHRLPLLAALFCGAALVVCLLCAFLLYRCCVMPRRDKHYCLRKVDPTSPATTIPGVSGSLAHQQLPQAAASATTVVFAERGQCYTNRLMTVGSNNPSPWYTPRVIGGPQCTYCPGQCQAVHRSESSASATLHVQQPNSTVPRRQRPVSQPIPANYDGDEILPRSPLPEISEFAPNSTQYASSSILDEVCGKEEHTVTEATLKTRSLPAWVRSKPRPLSTEDDINDLYAKVNFSKKRKNRMRNDEAAIIALSKSRSQFLHKDTDSLVDNEAVIVYDERTAL